MINGNFLTKHRKDRLVLLDEAVEYLICDLLDFIRVKLLHQPVKHVPLYPVINYCSRVSKCLMLVVH